MRQAFLYILLIFNILLSPLMATQDLTRDIECLEDQLTEAFRNLTGTQSYFDQINAELNKLCSGTSDTGRLSFLLHEKSKTYEDILVENQILDELLSDYNRLTGTDFVFTEETPPAPPVATVNLVTVPRESSTYTPPIDALKANTPFCRNGFTTTHVGRQNKDQLTSHLNLLNQANQNSLLPVDFLNPSDNFNQLKLYRPNKTPQKPTEQNIET